MLKKHYTKHGQNCLKKEVEQTKLASLAEKIFKSRETKEVIQTSIVHKIEYDGKVAGNIKFDHNTLKVYFKNRTI